MAGPLAFNPPSPSLPSLLPRHHIRHPTFLPSSDTSSQYDTVECLFSCTGKFKAAELISFLSKQAGPAASGEADDSASQGSDRGSGQKQKQEEKKDPKIVRDLNMTEFEELSDEEDAWLVAFYSGAIMTTVLIHCDKKS